MAVLPDPAVSNEKATQKRLKDSPGYYMNSVKSLLFPHTQLEDDVYNQNYSGNGTKGDPYIVDYLQNDTQDALNLSKGRKWAITGFQTLAAFAVTFSSSAYGSAIGGVTQSFNVSQEVATLGLSLYVLGFALGPLIWAPLSELYGRKSIFVISYTGYTIFSVAAAVSPNIASLLVFRFIQSGFGSSVMTNIGAIIADMFGKTERGLPTGLFAATGFLGPAFGPICGGFLAESQGWRWVLGLVSIVSGVSWIPTTLITCETYAPSILRGRAKALSQMTGAVYVSRLDAAHPPKTVSRELWIAFTRPFVLLFCEPIILLTSLYVSIVYGTLYMFFAGFPIVFQGSRGWSQGIAGLPFVGVAIGVCLAIAACGVDSKRYAQLCAAAKLEGRQVEPEARLQIAMVGSIILPIGLFLFAWTTYPSVPWILPVIGGTVFSCGLVMVFISLVAYSVDSYLFYAASALAANSLLRSLFATAFPLFTDQMYAALGAQWASSIPAFLTLGCLPFPFLFYRYGLQIRARCKFAAEAAKVLEMMHHRHGVVAASDPKVTEEVV